MNNEKVIYETGATSHAVNDLILFTDNTRELAELRDKIYTRVIETAHLFPGSTHPDMCKVKKVNINQSFLKVLLPKSIKLYIQQFPHKENHIHISEMSEPQKTEYVNLYVKDFDNWKLEHGYK